MAGKSVPDGVVSSEEMDFFLHGSAFESFWQVCAQRMFHHVVFPYTSWPAGRLTVMLCGGYSGRPPRIGCSSSALPPFGGQLGDQQTLRVWIRWHLHWDSSSWLRHSLTGTRPVRPRAKQTAHVLMIAKAAAVYQATCGIRQLHERSVQLAPPAYIWRASA